MRANYQALSYKELLQEIGHQKVLITYSERAMETMPNVFQNQTNRLKQELELLNQRLQELPQPNNRVTRKKTEKSKRIYN